MENGEPVVKLFDDDGRCVVTISPVKESHWMLLANMVSNCLGGDPEDDALIQDYLRTVGDLRKEFNLKRSTDGSVDAVSS